VAGLARYKNAKGGGGKTGTKEGKQTVCVEGKSVFQNKGTQACCNWTFPKITQGIVCDELIWERENAINSGDKGWGQRV